MSDAAKGANVKPASSERMGEKLFEGGEESGHVLDRLERVKALDTKVSQASQSYRRYYAAALEGLLAAVPSGSGNHTDAHIAANCFLADRYARASLRLEQAFLDEENLAP